MSAPGLFAVGLWALAGLTVKTTTPRALCPTPAAVEEQLAERLQVVATKGHDWTLELENGHAFGPPARDFIIVHLIDDHQTLLLDQRIDVTGADCGLRARSVALVIAEFLENSGPPPPSPPLPSPVPAPVEPEPSVPPASLPSDHRPPAARKIARPHAAASRSPSLHVGAAAALVDARFGGAFRLGFEPRPSLEVSLLAAFAGERHEAVGNGAASVRALPMRLGVSRAFPLGPLSAWLGADSFFSYEWAKTQGLARDRTNDRAVLGFGGQLGLRAPIVGSLGAFAHGAADYVLPLRGSRFEIDGREVLRPGPVRWTFVVGLEIEVLGRR